ALGSADPTLILEIWLSFVIRSVPGNAIHTIDNDSDCREHNECQQHRIRPYNIKHEFPQKNTDDQRYIEYDNPKEQLRSGCHAIIPFGCTTDSTARATVAELHNGRTARQ